MAYSRTTWVDGSTPAIDAANLNNIETGILGVETTANAAIPKSVVTAAGDLIYATGSGAVTNLATSNGKFLKAGASAPSWATPALSDLSGYPADAAKVPRGDGSWGVLATYSKVTAKDVVSSVTETDLLNGEITIAASQLTAGKMLRAWLFGDALKNTGSTTGPPQLKLKLGAATLLDTGASGGVWISTGINNATRTAWTIEVEIIGLTSATQRARMTLRESGVSTAVTGTGSSIVPGNEWEGTNSGAVDMTASQALVVSATNPANSASYSWRLQAAFVSVG